MNKMNHMNQNEGWPKGLFWTTKCGTIPLVDKMYIEMIKFFIQIRE